MHIDPKTYDMSGAVMYRKKGTVFARPGVPGEKIETVVDGVHETVNVVADQVPGKPADMVVRNPSGEEYIIKGKVFDERYEACDNPEDTPAGYRCYKAKGKALALQISHAFTINAPWDEHQHIDANGWLAINPSDPTDVYGIAEKAFHETYELDA